MPTTEPKSVHIIADLLECRGGEALQTDVELVSSLFERKIKEAGMTVVKTAWHSFGKGEGLSGAVIVAESHVAVHTWPETGLVNVDVFFCNYTEDNQQKAKALLDALCFFYNPKKKKVRAIKRY